MNRPTKRPRHPRTITTDERLAQYNHLLGVLPPVIVERAHAAAIAELSAEQRQRLLDQTRTGTPDAAPAADLDEPASVTALERHSELRDAILRAGVADAVALAFVRSEPVAQYFDVGAGSMDIDRQPLWVQELTRHEANPVDGGTVQHRKSRAMGMWWG